MSAPRPAVDSASPPLWVNGAPFPIEHGAEPTIADVLVALDLVGRRVAVEVNGSIVVRRDHSVRRVRPGDRVEIVTFVGGG